MGVNIFYALKAMELTFQGETKKRLQTIEEYEILKMTTERKQMGFSGEEIAKRRRKIQQETQKEWYYECEDWETTAMGDAMNPHLKRNQSASSDEKSSDAKSSTNASTRKYHISPPHIS